MSADGEFRTERDSMGEVRVPASARWGAQTQRAVENFPISGMRLERAQVEALARIKSAVASVKQELELIEPDLAEASSRSTSSRRARGPAAT
jgi:fumarate hydratase class II